MVHSSLALQSTQQKIKVLLVSIVLALSMLAAPFGIFGTQKASAADPRGDWYTQYSITRDSSGNYCVNYQYDNQRGYCIEWFYVDSGSYGPNSRYFIWRIHWSNMDCYRAYYIGNNYYIFNVVTYSCYRPGGTPVNI
jgi:hypothetical protein